MMGKLGSTPGRMTAWKEAAWIFGLSRLLILLTTVVSIAVLPRLIPALKHVIALSPPYSVDLSAPRVIFSAWFRWDAKAYVNISFVGYKYTSDTAFFPFWPLLQHFGGLVFVGSIP